MPKARYDIMRAYMPTKGTLGLDMMLRTCTVQTNLDFESESDMVSKFRVSLALQPLATALFANSPFVDGAPNGYLSYRAHIWNDTDPDRCGAPAFVFQSGMGFEAYVDYALDVPMYFVTREGRYIDTSGQSFRDFLDGKLLAMPDERPTLADWESHLTTIFTDVRLKQFLEMRGADGGAWRSLCALPALWVGLLYDVGALDEAKQLVREWSYLDIIALRADAATAAPCARSPRTFSTSRGVVCGLAVVSIREATTSAASLPSSTACSSLAPRPSICWKPITDGGPARLIRCSRNSRTDQTARLDCPNE